MLLLAGLTESATCSPALVSSRESRSKLWVFKLEFAVETQRTRALASNAATFNDRCSPAAHAVYRTGASVTHYHYFTILISARPGVEIVQYHSEAQLKEYGEANQHSEVCGHVYITHVVEP